MESKDLPEKLVRKNWNSIKIVGTFYTNACDRSVLTLKEPHLLIHSFVRSFVRSFVHPSIHPFNHSFIFSFIHPIYLFKHVSGSSQITLIIIIDFPTFVVLISAPASRHSCMIYKNTTNRDNDVVRRYSSLTWKVLSCSIVKVQTGRNQQTKQNCAL